MVLWWFKSLARKRLTNLVVLERLAGTVESTMVKIIVKNLLAFFVDMVYIHVDREGMRQKYTAVEM